MSSVQSGQWKAHSVRQLDKDAQQKEFTAQLQIITENWNRVVAVPYIVYMPEIDRVLMLVNCDYGPNLQPPHYAMVLFSDDRGTTWSEPEYVDTDDDGKPYLGMGIGLTYLGKGEVLLYASKKRWISHDYGKSWKILSTVEPMPGEKRWNIWDPPLVIKGKSGNKILETGYTANYKANASGEIYIQAFIRTSLDDGKSWKNIIKVPQWKGANEVALLKAPNNYIVAACRTEIMKYELDHYEGLAVSISRDSGASWSELNVLYDHGRHHPSMVLLPDGKIVMTYVVRIGYPNTDDGFPQFGIEAVISNDNGETWNLEHRYILTSWIGNRKGPDAWRASSQATSSILLPDGSILTAFGTGYRSQVDKNGRSAPRDVGLIKWHVDRKK